MTYNKLIKVKVNGRFYPLMEASLGVDEAIDERSTASFMLKTTDISVSIVKGMEVFIYDEFDTIVFAGFVNSARAKEYREHNFKIYSVECVDNHYLADKRIFVRGFVNTLAGDIVKTMVDEILSQENVTYTADSIEVGQNLEAISFPYLSCSDIMDKLCEICGYSWMIDYNKVIHFFNPNGKITDKVVTNEHVLRDTLISENGNNQYRNKQYIKGATGETGTIIQRFKGDGVTRSFALGYQLAEKPKIYVNGQYVYEDDIVIKGYNETAKWFYQIRDSVIVQNSEHTVLTASDVLEVHYQGTFPIIAITEDIAEKNRLQQIEHGSGIVEVVNNEDTITNISTAIQIAIGKLHKYGSASNKVTFDTYHDIFNIGELIAFDTDELSDTDYLVQAVTKEDHGRHIKYKITAVRGAIYDSWTRAFGNGLKRGETVANIDLAEQETVVISKNFKRVWLKDDFPNIFNYTKPSSKLFPSAMTQVAFNFEERVSFVEILDTANNPIFRTIKSTQSDASKDVIYTYFYVNPLDAVGTWGKVCFYGGHNATFEYGSGILLDEHVISLTKTQLEGVQITKTDTKGWEELWHM